MNSLLNIRVNLSNSHRKKEQLMSIASQEYRMPNVNHLDVGTSSSESSDNEEELNWSISNDPSINMSVTRLMVDGNSEREK